MSGILAWAGPDGQPPVPALRARLRAIAHRGRAAQAEHSADGIWVGAALEDSGDFGSFAGLTVALDGHPSNLRTLTAEQDGRESGATTPAEVVAAVLAELGVEKGLHRLEGTTALVIWDARDRTLWAVRDRIGARPMYAAPVSGGMLVGSEIHLPAAHAHKAVDFSAVEVLTRVGVLPAPLCTQTGVARLEAGSRLRWSAKSGPAGHHARWWDVPEVVPGRGGALALWIKSLEYAARMCVRHAYVGSGSTSAVWVEDASSVAVLAAARHPVDGPLPAIVVEIEGFAPPAEGARERLVARLGPDQLDEALDELAAHPEPTTDPDALLYWALARRADAAGITTILTGRGADAWLDPAPASPIARVRARLSSPAPTEPELQRIAAASPTQPPLVSWLNRRLYSPERALRTADVVGALTGTRFVAPLADPRLMHLGSTVPIGHHAAVAPLLWTAMGASAGTSGRRTNVPLRSWLVGPCRSLVDGLVDRLAPFMDPTSLTPLIEALPRSDAAAERIFALIAISRWLDAR